MSTVTTKRHPRFGTVEALAEILRPKYAGVDFIPIEGAIRGLLDVDATAEEKLAYIRNALAAAELVRAELEAVDQ